MFRSDRGSGVMAAVLVLGVLGGQAGSALGQSLEERDELHLVAGLNDTPSRMMAIGFSSLAKLQISSFDIDIVWSGLGDDPLDRVAGEGADLGLLNLEAMDPAAFSDHSNLRAVMKYWLEAEVTDGHASNGHPGYLVVAKRSLAPDMVSELVDAILADEMVLDISGIDRERFTPSISMIDLPLPLHQGVDDYLANKGIVLQTVDVDDTSTASKDNRGRSFTLYFETNDSALQRDDIVLVAEACKFAATLENARFVISGHTDTAGTEAYNEWLSARRATHVANAIRNDPRFREALSVLEFGEQNLAVSTGDGVREAMNRRVEITVTPGS